MDADVFGSDDHDIAAVAPITKDDDEALLQNDDLQPLPPRVTKLDRLINSEDDDNIGQIDSINTSSAFLDLDIKEQTSSIQFIKNNFDFNLQKDNILMMIMMKMIVVMINYYCLDQNMT